MVGTPKYTPEEIARILEMREAGEMTDHEIAIDMMNWEPQYRTHFISAAGVKYIWAKHRDRSRMRKAFSPIRKISPATKITPPQCKIHPRKSPLLYSNKGTASINAPTPNSTMAHNFNDAVATTNEFQPQFATPIPTKKFPPQQFNTNLGNMGSLSYMLANQYHKMSHQKQQQVSQMSTTPYSHSGISTPANTLQRNPWYNNPYMTAMTSSPVPMYQHQSGRNSEVLQNAQQGTPTYNTDLANISDQDWPFVSQSISNNGLPASIPQQTQTEHNKDLEDWLTQCVDLDPALLTEPSDLATTQVQLPVTESEPSPNYNHFNVSDTDDNWNSNGLPTPPTPSFSNIAAVPPSESINELSPAATLKRSLKMHTDNVLHKRQKISEATNWTSTPNNRTLSWDSYASVPSLVESQLPHDGEPSSSATSEEKQGVSDLAHGTPVTPLSKSTTISEAPNALPSEATLGEADPIIPVSNTEPTVASAQTPTSNTPHDSEIRDIHISILAEFMANGGALMAMRKRAAENNPYAKELLIWDNLDQFFQLMSLEGPYFLTAADVDAFYPVISELNLTSEERKVLSMPNILDPYPDWVVKWRRHSLKA